MLVHLDTLSLRHFARLLLLQTFHNLARAMQQLRRKIEVDILMGSQVFTSYVVGWLP